MLINNFKQWVNYDITYIKQECKDTNCTINCYNQ